MPSNTTVYLNTPFGTRIAQIPFLSLSYELGVNTVSALSIAIPPIYEMTTFVRDSQIEVWRSVDDGPEYVEGDKLWLIRTITQTIAADGTRTVVLGAVCANDLLRRRIIAYSAETAYTSKSGAADNVIKAFARENLGTLVVASRDSSLYANLSRYLTIANDVGQASSINVAATRDELLSTCQKAAAASATVAIYCAFDMVWDGARLIFQTFTQQRGTDHRAPSSLSPVVLSPDFGNLSDVAMTQDFSNETTIVIAGGQGVGTARTITVASDTARIFASPFGAVETFTQGNNSDANELISLSYSTLRAGRPRQTVTGRVQETPATLYGKHWRWGDRVTVQVDSVSYDARIDAVRVTREGGGETVDATIRMDDD